VVEHRERKQKGDSMAGRSSGDALARRSTQRKHRLDRRAQSGKSKKRLQRLAKVVGKALAAAWRSAQQNLISEACSASASKINDQWQPKKIIENGGIKKSMKSGIGNESGNGWQ